MVMLLCLSYLNALQRSAHLSKHDIYEVDDKYARKIC